MRPCAAYFATRSWRMPSAAKKTALPVELPLPGAVLLAVRRGGRGEGHRDEERERAQLYEPPESGRGRVHRPPPRVDVAVRVRTADGRSRREPPDRLRRGHPSAADHSVTGAARIALPAALGATSQALPSRAPCTRSGPNLHLSVTDSPPLRRRRAVAGGGSAEHVRGSRRAGGGRPRARRRTRGAPPPRRGRPGSAGRPRPRADPATCSYAACTASTGRPVSAATRSNAWRAVRPRLSARTASTRS